MKELVIDTCALLLFSSNRRDKATVVLHHIVGQRQ